MRLPVGHEEYSRALWMLGLVYHDKGELDKASDYYKRALQTAVDEDKAPICRDLGLCRSDLGDHDGAIEWYVKALEADSKDWGAPLSLGHICFDSKNWKAARAYYDQAIRLAKEDPAASVDDKADIHFALAWCCSRIKDYEGEESAYRA